MIGIFYDQWRSHPFAQEKPLAILHQTADGFLLGHSGVNEK